MPRRVSSEADAVPYRRGNTDYIETSVGRRAIRTFNGADGSWNLSKLGKRYFKSNALPEVVLRIPCVFLTTKKNGEELRHLGWFSYELLDEGLRARASLGSTCPARTPRTEPGRSTAGMPGWSALPGPLESLPLVAASARRRSASARSGSLMDLKAAVV